MVQQHHYLITGATSGLGLATAKVIAKEDPANIVITGARSTSQVDQLKQIVPDSQLIVMELDTSSLASTKNFSRNVRNRLGVEGIAGLALNAGIQIVSGDQFSKDGHELTFATNVLGHIALFEELAPHMLQKAVVVSTASGTHDKDHKLARPYNFFGGYFPSIERVAAGDVSPSVDQAQQGRDRYATSKLCNVLFTYAMARKHGNNGPRFIAFDPGLMPGTELVRDNSAAIRFAWKNILPTAAKMIDGASTAKASGDMLAQVLMQQHIATGTGLHVEFTGKQIPSSAMSYDETLQDALITWAHAQFERA